MVDAPKGAWMEVTSDGGSFSKLEALPRVDEGLEWVHPDRGGD
jgi:hypothetical protein